MDIKVRKKILSYIRDFTILAAIFTGITVWQTRDMLSSSTPAPELSLPTLNGEIFSNSTLKNRKAVLYFFSPWCTVCKASSHNIRSIYKSVDPAETAVVAVALSWHDPKEVREFVKNHGLDMPVLLGTDETARDYHIDAYPSIYLLDRKANIGNQLVGYTTELGIRLRLFFL